MILNIVLVHQIVHTIMLLMNLGTNVIHHVLLKVKEKKHKYYILRMIDIVLNNVMMVQVIQHIIFHQIVLRNVLYIVIKMNF